MDSFLRELRAAVQGELRSDPISRRAYSVDASICEVEPLAILQPLNSAEVSLALQIAAHYNIPVTARGAATGITGGCLGSGLILDLSRHLTNIIAIDTAAKVALCEPGVIQDDLNRALSPLGYRLGPDTSTGDRATLGGMLANNAAGARSLCFGCMADHVLEVDLALATGEILTRGTETARRLDRALGEIRASYGAEIAAHFPRLPRRSSGYNLGALLEPEPNLGKLIAGSEGTLGIATRIKMRICPKVGPTVLCLIYFDSLLSSLQAVEQLLSFQPLSLELLDDQVIALGRAAPSLRGRLSWLTGAPQALLVAEFEAQEQAELAARSIGRPHALLTDPHAIEEVWQLRKSGLGLLLSRRTYSRAIAFIEDIALPPERLAAFMEKFLPYLKAKGKQAGIYGHAGAGCLHIRPYMDLRHGAELALMHQMMLDVCDLLVDYGGVLSGEHGDGLVRSWLNERLFGPKLYKAFVALKSAFDPDNRLNPGKIVHGPPPEQHLRLGPTTPIRTLPTFLDFSREGGIELAADLCNGNGLCRKRDTIMCPSFQATGDEYDTTRARAQALRGIIHGQLELNAGVLDVLDLCIECKGCKSECPSQVDMAKMKAELLYQHQEKQGYSLRNRLFGHLARFYQFASPLAPLVNSFARTRLAKWLLGQLGIAPERPLPRLARERFSHWMESHAAKPGPKQVVLFNDTYTEFLQPEIGIAAVKVLEALGYAVIVPPWRCCGRPLISKGLLRPAEQQAQLLVDALYPYVQQGLKIVGLEPSCILTIADDFAGLLGAHLAQLKEVAAACCTFDAFVAAHLPLDLMPLPQTLLLHGHCHQKALVGMEPTLALLRTIPQARVEEIPSGCCGMAGSFGYEREHYALSLKIGELKLLPAVRSSAPGAVVIANGLSCRTQIAHGAGREALHLAQVLAPLMRPLAQ